MQWYSKAFRASPHADGIGIKAVVGMLFPFRHVILS